MFSTEVESEMLEIQIYLNADALLLTKDDPTLHNLKQTKIKKEIRAWVSKLTPLPQGEDNINLLSAIKS